MQEVSHDSTQEKTVDIFFYRFRGWVFKNYKIFFGGLLALLLLIASGFGAYWYHSSQAEIRLTKIQTLEDRLLSESDDAQSLSLIDSFLDEYPEEKSNFVVLARKIDALKDKGDKEGLEQLLTDYRAKPENPPILKAIFGFYLAELYLEQDRKDEALQFLEGLNSAGIEDLRLYNLGLLYLERKDFEKAKEMFNQILTGYPQSPLARIASTLNSLI